MVRPKLTWGHAATSHGGARSGSSGSIGGAMPAASQASSPVLRQPVTDFSLCGGSAYDTTSRGSSSGSARAFARSRAARMGLRADTGTSPASAITAWAGVERGQPVITRAAARISLSRSSTCECGVPGSHAAAACSSAPRT